MPQTTRSTRSTRPARRAAFMLLAVLSLAATACKDSTGPEEEPEVETMRITIAGQAPLTVASNGAVTGTLTIPRAVATLFTVEFLNAAGSPDPHVNATEFLASVAPTAGITFARTGAFTGSLTGAAAGTVSVSFGLFHIAEAHDDFGPFPVNITITP